MQQLIIKKISLLLTLLFIFACNTDDIKTLNGSIIGFIHPTDEFGNFLNDKSGVNIEIIDGNKRFLVRSSADGKYEFHNVPQGTYNIIFSKTGFGTTKLLSVSHTGGSNPTSVDYSYIAKYSSTTISDFDVNEDGNISGMIHPEHRNNLDRRGAVIFIDKNKTVSDTINLRSIYAEIRYNYTFSENPFDIYDKYFNVGDTVYVKAYGYSGVGNNNAYYKPDTGEYIYPYYSRTPSETRFFIMK
jgi:hypothetical protein